MTDTNVLDALHLALNESRDIVVTDTHGNSSRGLVLGITERGATFALVGAAKAWRMSLSEITRVAVLSAASSYELARARRLQREAAL